MDTLLNEKQTLESLILESCKCGLAKVDENVLKQIKSLCKSNELHLRFSFEILNTQLKKDHSEIRYSAFQIIDCLFQRSHLFRELVLEELQNIFELVLEINSDEELPPPRKAAKELKKTASKSIKAWHEKFGKDYKLLDLGFNYLKNCKKVDFVSFSHQTNAQRVHIEKQNEKQQIFLNKKYNEYVQEMKDKEVDIKSCIDQLDRCIKLLFPNDDLFVKEDFEVNSKKTPSQVSASSKDLIENECDDETNDDSDDSDSLDEDDFVEVPMKKSKEETQQEQNLEMKYLGFLDEKPSIDNLKNIKIRIETNFKEDEENKVVIDIMRDLNKELKNSHLVKINTWIKNFGIIKQSSDNLKKAIELKNMVQAILKRFEELNIKSSDSNQNVNDKSNDPKKTAKQTSSTSLCNIDDPEDNSNRPTTSKKSIESNSEIQDDILIDEKAKKKREMLKIAPVIDLNEMEFLAPIVQMVETSHPLYQRRENELPQDIMDNAPRLTKKIFVGNFEPIKWSCRAPLKSGRLCPRMDRFKCPLHGKIVARDELGQIVNENDRIEAEKNKKEIAPWQDAELLADINAATGQNIQVINKDKKGKGKKEKLEI